MQTRIKEPSTPTLYRLLAVDMFSFDKKVCHMSQNVQLPTRPRLGPGELALPTSQRLPPLLVFHLQLPTYPATLMGPKDGPGLSCAYYFGLPEGFEPSSVPNQAALALVRRFVHDGREADGTPTRDRLKVIPRIVNVEQWAVEAPLYSAEARIVRNYNDKPLMTRPQQKFYRGPGYLEVELDIHNYAYIARKAYGGYVPRLKTAVYENAFVVQGGPFFFFFFFSLKDPECISFFPVYGGLCLSHCSFFSFSGYSECCCRL
jgi:hypothetical protein